MIAHNDRSELWGPISYFQPILKWMAFVATGLLCSSVLIGSGERS